MINELLSEASSNHDYVPKLNIINVLVKDNSLHAKLDDSQDDVEIHSPKNSSHSSVNEDNRRVVLTKPQYRKVIPR
jgi:hypothetical protein